VNDAVYTGAVVEGFETTLGRVISTSGDKIVFQPRGTTYELHLVPAGGAAIGAGRRPVRGLVKVVGRKAYTVPSGGAFIVPIMGTPRIVQGRVIRGMENGASRRVLLKAGAEVVAELPAADHAIDLNHGPIEPGVLLNVVCEPGAAFEPAT